MILADENISLPMIKTLREKGIEVTSIFEDHRSISDEQIIELSLSPRRIILTRDKDFGEWIFAHKKEKVSVILLRYSRNDEPIIASMVCNLIEEKGDWLFNKFVTVKLNSIRVREL